MSETRAAFNKFAETLVAKDAPQEAPAKAEEKDLAAAPVVADGDQDSPAVVAEGTDESPQAEQDDGAVAEQEPLHTVVIDGKEEAVPLSKLLASYQRGESLGAKEREAAAVRKQAEALRSEVGNLQKNYVERLNMLDAALKPQLPTPEAMNAALQAGRTAEYLQMQNQLMQYNAVMAERERETVKLTEQQQAELQARKAEESRLLLEKAPEFKDEGARKRLAEYLVKQGVPQEEVDSINNHTVILLAEKARKWDELQSKKPELQKRVDGLPKLAKTASRQAQGSVQQHNYSQAMKTLQETGTFANEEQRRQVFGRFLGI